MKKLLAPLLAATFALPAFAGEIGVSIEFSQPGLFGRVDVGRFPQPQLVVPQPVLIAPPRVVVGPPVQPVYMWVPYEHRKDWRRHCRHYGACGVPVYFVRHDWYDREVRRRHRDDDDRHGHRHAHGHPHGHKHGHKHGHRRDRDDD